MSEVDLSDFSIPELQELSNDIEKEIKRRQADEVKRVRRQMKELAASVGMTPEEILLGRGPSERKSAKGVPQYQNPENPEQTWTGKGKRPGWVHEQLARGKSLEDLRIH